MVRRERERGFSLIELLIVVAIILIIVTIAIPNFTGTKIAANETAAVASLGFAVTFLALGFKWIQSARPESLFIWMALYFGFSAA